MSIQDKCIARAALSELSDEIIKNANLQYYDNRLVLARIIKIKEDGKIELSLRESIIKYGYNLSLESLKMGLTVQGVVTGYRKDKKALVTIQGCKYHGTLSLQDHV